MEEGEQLLPLLARPAIGACTAGSARRGGRLEWKYVAGVGGVGGEATGGAYRRG